MPGPCIGLRSPEPEEDSASGPSRLDIQNIKQGLVVCGLGIVGGVMLFISSLFILFEVTWWLQLCAMVPLLWIIFSKHPTWHVSVLAGGLFGMVYIILTLWIAPEESNPAGPLWIYEGLLWALFFTAAGQCAALPPLRRIAAIAGAAVLLGWLDITLMPAWGSAQLFVRPMTAVPFVMQICAWAGPLGVVCAVTAFNVALALLLTDIAYWKQALGTIAGIVLVLGISAIPAGLAQPTDTITASAISWRVSYAKPATKKRTEDMLEKVRSYLIAPMIQMNADLIVFRGGGFRLNKETRELVRTRLVEIGQRHGVYLAVGYRDEATHKNGLLFINPEGEIFDTDGSAPLLQGLHVSRNDDGTVHMYLLESPPEESYSNASQLARILRRNGANLVISSIPGNREAGLFHYEHGKFIAVENRMAFILASDIGYNTIVDARGVVQEKHMMRTFDQAMYILEHLPLYNMGAPYRHIGNWPALLAFFIFGIWGLRIILVRRHRPAPAGPADPGRQQ